ncbi:MAG TPA: peptidoglycan-binding protein [Solirubrobacteraceae bacterium]|nr:peptidoglycan-binding protein [Solirubrobacteraceae bacterium]
MVSAGRSATTRSIALAGTLWAVTLAICCCPLEAAGSPGGTAPPGAQKGTSAPVSSGTSAHVTSVRITGVACTPSQHCTGNPRQVSTHGTLLIKGVGLKAGMVLGFPKTAGASVTTRSPGARLRNTTAGLAATVPKAAHSGHVKILLSRGRYTSSYGPIYVYTHALHPPLPKVTSPAKAGGVAAGAFEGQGMWIWYVSRSSGGSIPAIVSQAHAAGVTTVFVKSSDGSSNYWSQFSPALVAALHAAGLKVCAWQYVYGTNPAGEAALGTEAVTNGADCLVIDAEAEYEGKYAAAQTYVQDLRAKIGPSYPLGLASFPYVSYHSSEPYSVFLGPGGAQFNLPQMYWKAIGTSVDTVYANTYIANRIYQRPIFPLGQTYESPSPTELLRFREEAVLYGAPGWSFWDWQETSSAGWSALAAPMTPLATVTPNTSYPELSKGSKGDQVLWLQEHLATAIPSQETTGNFGNQTIANLKTFQSAHGIEPSGVATAQTWAALLSLEPVAVNWTGK